MSETTTPNANTAPTPFQVERITTPIRERQWDDSTRNHVWPASVAQQAHNDRGMLLSLLDAAFAALADPVRGGPPAPDAPTEVEPLTPYADTLGAAIDAIRFAACAGQGVTLTTAQTQEADSHFAAHVRRVYPSLRAVVPPPPDTAEAEAPSVRPLLDGLVALGARHRAPPPDTAAAPTEREVALRKRVFDGRYGEDEEMLYGRMGAAQALIRLLDERLRSPAPATDDAPTEVLAALVKAARQILPAAERGGTTGLHTTYCCELREAIGNADAVLRGASPHATGAPTPTED